MSKLIAMKRFRFLTCLFVTFISLDTSAQKSGIPATIQNGQRLYEMHCISCHMQDGNGVPAVYPTLIKTPSLANKSLLVKIIQQGQRGPLVVKGINYNGEMAPISLTDKEVADVLNYVRNSWGNKAPLIKASEIPAARKASVKGFQPY